MTGPGLAYLLGGVAVVALWIMWLRVGKAVCVGFAESLVETSKSVSARWRWTMHPWSSTRLAAEAEQCRAAFWMWLPLTLSLPLLALLLLASAVVEFTQ